MANLSKTKTLFGFTSPRTIQKIIPEIRLLYENFNGENWRGNKELQEKFFSKLFNSEYYDGATFPADPALAARDRITRAPKALGFVNLSPSIQLTKAGKALISLKRNHEIFTKQLMKFQLPSPYHTQSKTTKFNVKPYLELLLLINDLGSLSKTEIAIFFLQLTNYQKFDIVKDKILKFRKDSKKYKGSRKMYVKECFFKEILLIYEEEIKKKKYKTRESTDDTLKKFIATKISNMKDYADSFVRYIRATELVTFQRKTLRLIVSPQKKNELDYILENLPREPKKFSTEEAFKNYLFNPNSILLLNDNKALLLKQIKTLGASKLDESLSIEELKDILDELSQNIKINNINEQKQEIKSYKILPEILAVFQKIKRKEIADASLFLEWNVWRALVMLNYALRIDGNFIMDIDGMPLNYAPGNKPDIVSEFEKFCLITEVTMSSGHTQYRMENESVPRHFGTTKEAVQKETYCIFIAPKISEGTLAHYFNLNKMKTKLYGGKTKIIPLTITQFINFVEIGVNNKFDNPQKLKDWLETQWKNNQILADEEIWFKSIENNLPTWLET